MSSRYFLDTEFIEDGRTIDLISIGLVCEDGREFYAENIDAKLQNASDWVQENVINHLWSQQSNKAKFNAWLRDGGEGGLLSHKEIAREVELFCNPEKYNEPEFWADYCSYDWVALCQLFGPMMDLPDGFPMYCNDIRQLWVLKGKPDLPKQETGNHHALYDARHDELLYIFLNGLA